MTKIIPNAQDVPRSVQVGDRFFSSANDYETYFVRGGLADTPHAVWTSPQLAMEAQRHWYWQGQVGCLFARRAARKPEDYGWMTRVVLLDSDELTPDILTSETGSGIAAAASSLHINLVSFLFPKIRRAEKLVPLIRSLIETPYFTLSSAESFGMVKTISLQSPVPRSPVMAWVLGFGPFDCLPPTRRAPSIEVIVRPKVKPATVFHRVNQDRSISHLADTPLHMDDPYAELVWQETLRSVCSILGHAPDRLSAAKTTFCVPIQAWDS